MTHPAETAFNTVGNYLVDELHKWTQLCFDLVARGRCLANIETVRIMLAAMHDTGHPHSAEFAHLDTLIVQVAALIANLDP